MEAEHEVTIERILPGGVGLAHGDGKTLLVPLAAPGDRVRIRIERQQGNVYFASITEILEPSPMRIEPPCPYFGRCGGCDFQQLTYEAQLAVKAEIIRDCLHRIARIDYPADIIVRHSPAQWRYRARATWQLDAENGMTGYYERGSRRVCDVADCAVLVPELQSALERVRATPLDKIPSGLKHLDVVRGENGVSLSPAFADFLTAELSLHIGAEVYSYNAEAFFQVNQELLEALLAFTLEDTPSTSAGTALDLYCGVGLFTLPLARRFKRVVGIEANSNAARFARRNLQRAELINTTIANAGVGEWLTKNCDALGPIDLVLLDPPRAGAESIVIKRIVGLKPAHICYVSCDPATLARDLKKLIADGYQLDSLAAFDMFPQTHHVETVVHLTR